jgi:hypothetical protein
MVAPRQETTTGAAGASEPLCIAQGAAANVPKFPRPHPHLQAPILRHYVPRTTLELQDVFCTPAPKTTYPPACEAAVPAQHTRIKPLTPY